MNDFMIGMKILVESGATSMYAVSETLYVFGADITASVEPYGFCWCQEEDAWMFYT